MTKMKVEIWSDVMCPFCYIGKRKFEQALAEFPDKDAIQVEWHSFQLNPDISYQPGVDIYDYVAKMKGQSREWSEQVHQSLVASAKAVGLDYRFDQVKMANSFDAHRVIQLAKKYGFGDEMEERLFKAYFTEGALISDREILAQLAIEAGLDQEAVKEVLASNQYVTEVQQDIAEAQRIGVTGVPFFVMDRKYAVSGAQDPQVFLETLQKSFAEWRKANPAVRLEVAGGDVCRPDGRCER